MIPVVIVAFLLAWKSYSSTLLPEKGNPATTFPQGRSSGGGGGAGQPTPAQMMDAMAKELSLSPDQKTRIAAIQEDVAAKRKAMPQGMDRDERRKKMTEYRTAADTQIKALLNADQQTKYDAMQEKRRAQMQAMRGGGGGRMGGGGPTGGPGGQANPAGSAPTPGKPATAPGG